MAKRSKKTPAPKDDKQPVICENSYGSQESFREWLIARVATTGPARRAISDDMIDGAAREMGILPDILVEARLRVLRERVSAGLRPVKNDAEYWKKKHYQFELLFPEDIFRVWKLECERRSLDGSALMRSAIHGYLMGSWEPRELLKHWVWHGIGYSVQPALYHKAHHSRYPFRERASMPLGVKRALERRASRMGVTSSCIVRGLVLSIVNGEWGQPGTFQIVDGQTMFDDEDRYARFD